MQRQIEDSGVDLNKTGKNLAGRYPLHEDDMASWVVKPARNLRQTAVALGNPSRTSLMLLFRMPAAAHDAPQFAISCRPTNAALQRRITVATLTDALSEDSDLTKRRG